jgi:hypothetical protein
MTFSNGSISTAKNLTSGVSRTDQLLNSDDKDYFKLSADNFSVPSQILVSFDGDFSNQNDLFDVSIRTQADAVVVSEQFKVSGNFTADVNADTNYYIRVASADSYDSSDYTLSYSVIETAESELGSNTTNDTRATANLLVDNSSFKGTLSSASDSDWYYFTTGTQDGGTVSLTLSAFASDATYYDVKITDENGVTLSKSGGDALATTAGQSDGSITFTVASGSPTEAATYFVNVAANNAETFETSSEFGNNYTLSLTGSTDYNSTPSVTINGVASGEYAVPVENENVYSNVSTESETLLSTLVTASDSDTAQTPNGTISTYILGLYGEASTAGTIQYIKTGESEPTFTSISAKAADNVTGFFHALTASEFETAKYVAGTSEESQKLYVAVRDGSGVSDLGVTLTVPSDQSGLVKYTLNTADAGVIITGVTDTALIEGDASTSQTLTATIDGTPTATVNLILDLPDDLELTTSENVKLVSEQKNTYRIQLDAGTPSQQFEVSAINNTDGAGLSEVVSISYSTLSDDAEFDELSISATSFTVSENIANFTISDITYETDNAVSEADSTATATYTITANNLNDEELTLNLVGPGLEFETESFVLNSESSSAVIVVRAEDDAVVEDGIHTHAIQHSISEGDTPSVKYLNTISNQSISVMDNDSATGATISVFDAAASNATAAPNGVQLQFVSQGVSALDATTASGSISVDSTVQFTHAEIANQSAVYTSDIAISDVIAQLKDIVGLTPLSGTSAAAADVDNNGSIEIADVIANLKHIVGLETIKSFDVVNSSSALVTELSSSMVDTNIYLVQNGDVDLSGTFII